MQRKRTHTCGELRKEHEGQSVTLMGWVDRRRDHGGVIFIDLRDRYGKTQIVFNPENKAVYQIGKTLRGEFVIAVSGRVAIRPAGMANETLATGEIEVIADDCEVLNAAKTPPFEIIDNIEVSEELRLKYRYLDLRRPTMQNNLLLRHRLYQVVRRYFDENQFVEIETPMLMKSTPEGARDYLVPSRIHKGKFYALPQSPQTYKQILMVAGFDRYFQIVKCFRDEDLRADRQPEFTQIDVEMSFVDADDVLGMVEGLMQRVMKEIKGVEIETPFPRLSYAEAMEKYGSDKPDLRFGLPLVDISEIAKGAEFRVFREVLENNGTVKGIRVPGGSAYSRKRIDELTEFVKEFGARGLVAIKIGESDWDSGLAKFFDESTRRNITQTFGAESGDLLLIVADERERTNTVLGNLRNRLARDENLIPDGEYNLLWVVDFPLLEYDEEEHRYVARHHPFTSPMEEDLHLMDTAPEKVRAKAYDLVLNGYEIAGGSIRIHKRDLQNKMFSLLKISPEEAEKKFGFLLEAFEYGAPPHGGIAFGFDRLAMILAGRQSIRDVIAFPKTNSALSLMDGAPSEVDARQLRELGIKIIGT
ncbi:MAG: aspartate--tRNA ligase [candidate division KSB1 bacterium]|nr:aspartate--tRNA ligase [candidate division KSB1 bacterium]MDQ7064573.1 aspartate--tRNA ligase [candidate division KSB1 bacterium]